VEGNSSQREGATAGYGGSGMRVCESRIVGRSRWRGQPEQRGRADRRRKRRGSNERTNERSPQSWTWLVHISVRNWSGSTSEGRKRGPSLKGRVERKGFQHSEELVAVSSMGTNHGIYRSRVGQERKRLVSLGPHGEERGRREQGRSSHARSNEGR
jgi:hypothetical protein